MKAKIVSIGVADDQSRGHVEVEFPADGGKAARVTFGGPVDLAVSMARGDFLGKEVSVTVTIERNGIGVVLE